MSEQVEQIYRIGIPFETFKQLGHILEAPSRLFPINLADGDDVQFYLRGFPELQLVVGG